MEVGLDLKLMAGRYGCIFSHCEHSKAVSGKLNSPMRRGKRKKHSCLLYPFHRQRQPQDYIGRGILLYFNVCFGDCS